MTDDIPSQLGQLLPRLRRFAQSLSGSASDAEDLVQVACERALSRSGQLREVNRLDAWMYGIIRHLWQDERRRRSVRRHEPIEEGMEIAAMDGRTVAENRLELAHVRACLARLSADHRAVLTLVCVDGLSYREAADVLRIPIGTIMSRLARARRDLHTQLTSHQHPMPATVVPMPTRGRAAP